MNKVKHISSPRVWRDKQCKNCDARGIKPEKCERCNGTGNDGSWNIVITARQSLRVQRVVRLPWGVDSCSCGSRRVFVEHESERPKEVWRAHCEKCGKSLRRRTQAEATKSWNTRTVKDSLTVQKRKQHKSSFQWFTAKDKLRAAKAEGAKRAKKKYDADRHDEFKRLQSRTWNRVNKYGIPPELPKLKTWDYAKGKVA